MDRDGIYPSYDKFKISKEQERKWMKELTKIKLDKLDNKGNWSSIFFLNHHSDFEHLNKILDSEPLGKYWEKCAFLEELYKMTKFTKFSRTDNLRIMNYIIAQGNLISEKTKTPDRINELLNKIKNYS